MSETAGPQFDADLAGDAGEDRDGELLEMFDRWGKALSAHWSEWQETARAEFDFAAGRQWSEDDKATIEESGKIPVVFNLVGPALDAVSGAEIQNRQQVQYYPREVGDTGVSDALTQGAEYVNDECNGDQEDSEAFFDALVCGIGDTYTYPDVNGDQVTIVKERKDPTRVLWDPSSRKRCFEDARYVREEIPMSRDEFEDFKEEIGQPDSDGDDAGLSAGKRLTVVNPRQRYTNGMLGGDQTSDDEVIVCRWEWWEREPVHMTAIPSPQEPGQTSVHALTPDEHDQAQQLAKEHGLAPLKSTKTTRKAYYYAYVGDGEVLDAGPLQENAFRYKAITGKRDRGKGTWYGLVRPMTDPQRFTNKLYSEILHIIRTNANGGMALEEDAVADVRDFESSWSASDKITWLKPGALSQNKMLPKTPPPVQPALFQLMEFARDMVQRTTGINEEILGLVGREQAGVLEYQRKQAAYGLLSPFFDAARRYRRDWGKLLLTMMRMYLPGDKLTRLVDQGTVQYVPLSQTLEAAEYDVIVDDAPSGPNQKAKVMQVLMPLLPELFQAGVIGPEEIADVLPYTDLPAAVADKLASAIRQKAQNAVNPQAQQMQAEGAEAEIDAKRADAEHKRAQAFKAISSAHDAHAQRGVEFLAANLEREAQQGQEAAPQQPNPTPQAQPAPPPGGAMPGPAQGPQ